MGIHIYLLLLFQTLWCSVIGQYDPNVGVSMTHTILTDRVALKKNNVIQAIWQQEPATTCDIEKPSEKMLTNKRLLQFHFFPYLCVILYDASIRYIKLNASHGNAEISPDIPQKIVSEFLPDLFCQKMKENNWYTSIEENKLWVSNFNNDMKNINSCRRYCVGDGVNPICAYALWLDLSVKNVEHELSHPNSNESHPLPKEQVNASIGKQPPVVHAPIDSAHVLPAESTRPNVNARDSKPSPIVSAAGQMVNAVTPKQSNDILLARRHPAGEGIPVTSGHRPPFPNSAPFPAQINTGDRVGGRVLTGSAPENSRQLNISPLGHLNISPSLQVPVNNPKTGKPSGPPGPLAPNVVQNTYHSQTPRQFPKPDETVLNRQPDIKGSSSKEDKMGTTQKETSVDQQSVSATAELEHTKTSSTTLSASPQHAAETPPVSRVPIEAGVENSPAENMEEHQTEGLEQVSGDHKTSDNLERGYESLNGQQDGTSNIVSPANPSIPSVPETPDIPEHTEDETHKVRGNTTVPENDTKEVPGSPKGETTETKPSLDQIEKSEPEANPGFEGEDGRASNGDPDNHEEQNALDDGVADSQIENGDTLGVHGGDRDEAGIEMDQDLPTEVHRYNEGENDELPRPDDSTKLSNNNNNYMAGSDEDETDWSAGEQARIPQNDADAGYAHDRFVDAEDSHFFAYFMTMIVLCIIGYLIFHNKQKILALALEGRVRKGTRRRPSTSGYRKLDSNLEEAVTSSCSASVTHVIY